MNEPLQLPGPDYCRHETFAIIAEALYSVPVSDDENPAAHGGVCYTVECRGCRRWRRENHNGPHREIGPWQPRSAHPLVGVSR